MMGKRSLLPPIAACACAIALTVGLMPGAASAQTGGAASGALVAGTSDALVAASAEGAVETSINVYTVDTQGNYVETDEIGTALAAAGADPSDGPAPALSAQALSGDGFVIVLDPGHGGYDSGAGGYGLLEKDVNLKIAEYCRAKLEQTPGVTVYMTRTDNDTYVELSARTAFAVDHGADLVVSIHNNSGGGSGSEVIVPNSASWLYETTYLTGRELGSRILSGLNALGLGTHSGVYSRDNTANAHYPDGSLSDYYALVNGPRYNGILGIIVEHAFIDNGGDVAWLNNDANLKRLGEADADAIISYYDSSAGLDRLYWGVYDFDYYTSHYADVKASYPSKLQALGYFKGDGMAAGHRGNAMFDVSYYKENNPDLQAAFGDDLKRYYKHFMTNGMSEGRQGSAEFNPRYYRANYPDLRETFGSDWKSYYKHYVQYGISEGRVADALIEGASFSDSVYRLYNPYNGDHHYTTSSAERDMLAGIGWSYEGVAWNTPDAESAAPVYRLYNPYSGDHHYTMSVDERNTLDSIGWNYEGVAWYSDDESGAPLYRLYNPWLTAGTHHYTLGVDERDYLASIGWSYEGIAWYGAKD